MDVDTRPFLVYYRLSVFVIGLHMEENTYESLNLYYSSLSVSSAELIEQAKDEAKKCPLH